MAMETVPKTEESRGQGMTRQSFFYNSDFKKFFLLN